MKNIAIHCIFILFLSIHFNAFATPADEAPDEMLQTADNSVICKFKDTTLPDNVATFAQQIVTANGVSLRHQFKQVIKGFSATMSLTAAENLQKNNPNIDYCVNNGLVVAGVKGGAGGKPGQVQAQVVPVNITRVGGPIDGTGLTAWILDSGIDLDHPDLNVDVERGFDAVSAVARGRSTFDDVNGHGTHVAGILAAIDNDRDIVGVAAGATVVPVRVLAASSYGYFDDVIAGIDYVASLASPLDVVNMSFFGWKHNRALHDAAYNLADLLPVITIVGNDEIDINREPTEPGHVEHPNLYTVSAINLNDTYASFSSWGFAGDWPDQSQCHKNYPNDPYPCATVDYAAPGNDIVSLKPGGDLATWYGTSMAAPHVAGIILLLQKRVPNPNSDGFAIGDPDGSADPIIHY